VPGLTVHAPKIDVTDKGKVANLALLIRFAQSMLGVSTSQTRIYYDESLGADVAIPANVQHVVESISLAAASPTGTWVGDIYSHESGFKANLPELLAALKMLSKYVRNVRRKTDTKKQKYVVCTLQYLRTQFNGRSGISSLKESYLLHFMKETLTHATRITNDRFPNVFISSLKQRNQVTTVEGLLSVMGYTPKAVNYHKLMTVLYHSTTVTENDKAKLFKLPEGSKFSYPE